MVCWMQRNSRSARDSSVVMQIVHTRDSGSLLLRVRRARYVNSGCFISHHHRQCDRFFFLASDSVPHTAQHTVRPTWAGGSGSDRTATDRRKALRSKRAVCLFLSTERKRPRTAPCSQRFGLRCETRAVRSRLLIENTCP